MATEGYIKKFENIKMNISDECLKNLGDCMEDYLSTLPLSKEKKIKIKNTVVLDAKRRFRKIHCYSVNTTESSWFFKTLIKSKVKKEDITPIFLIIRTNEQIAISNKLGDFPENIVF